MSSQIIGKIKSLAVNLNRVEPQSTLNTGEVMSGQVVNMSLGFENKGNVTQIVTVLPFTNFINCSYLGGTFVVNGFPTPVPEVAELPPDTVGMFNFQLQANEIPIGSPDIELGVSVDWIWS